MAVANEINATRRFIHRSKTIRKTSSSHRKHDQVGGDRTQHPPMTDRLDDSYADYRYEEDGVFMSTECLHELTSRGTPARSRKV